MKTVLVADDEAGYRDLYVFLLKPMGYEVECVNNGKEAVEAIAKKPYDLLLIDVHMPVMDGLQAIRLIRQSHPTQKIVVFSSSSDPSFMREQQAIAEGVITCLYKPVLLDDFKKVIHQALG